MKTSNVMRAEKYYTLVGEKNIEGIKQYLHPDAELHSPLATLKGKENVVQATRNYMNMIESLRIRAKFGEGDQAVIIYDVDIPGIAKNFPAAVLLSFRNELIIKIELFYASHYFVEKKKEIFS